MISREESKNEIVNDAHSWVYNWWKQIRDNPDELAYLIDNTARSRQLFEELTHRQMGLIRDGYFANTTFDAWNFFVVCNFSVHHGIETRPGQYGVRFKAAKSYKIWDASTVGALNQRLKRVQIENVCATRVIEKALMWKIQSFIATRLIIRLTPLHTENGIWILNCLRTWLLFTKAM